MGCPYSADREASKRSKEIDQMLKKDAKYQSRLARLLLLGLSQSGKSTFAKQMRIIHGHGYSENERMDFKNKIHNNTISAMFTILKAMESLKIEFGQRGRAEDAKQVLDHVDNYLYHDEGLPCELAASMKRLWEDSGVQKCFQRASEFYICDSAGYFLNSLDRISEPNYIPTYQDILQVRTPATGIFEYSFEYRNYPVMLYDFGGTSARNPRCRFLLYSENMRAVIFFIAMSEYDKMSFSGGERKSNLIESLELLDLICQHRCLSKMPIIVFLNKRDLFEEKIKKTPLTVCFPEYEGDNTCGETAAYIRKKVENLNKREQIPRIYTHCTCCTDTTYTAAVFANVACFVIRNGLESYELL